MTDRERPRRAHGDPGARRLPAVPPLRHATFDGPTIDVTRPYVQALEARGLPHLLVGGKSFHEREEVETLRTALAAIEWPDDELSVFGTLRGALFAFGDDVLLDYRGARPPLPARSGRWRGAGRRARAAAVDAATSATPSDAAARPAPAPQPAARSPRRSPRCSRRRGRTPSSRSGRRASRRWPTSSTSASWRARTEAGGGLSFRGFVERLREEAEETRAAEAPILEEGSDGVRLMTVHKAKGLEFPVVVLVDIGAELSRSTASRWVDSEGARCAVSLAGWAPAELREHAPVEVARDEAEGVRVAYVAATRARDLLVVCAVGDGPVGRLGEPAERRDLSGDGSAARGDPRGAGPSASGPTPPSIARTPFRSPACGRASTPSTATSPTP